MKKEEKKSIKSSHDMLAWQYKTLLGEVQQIELHETGDCPCILNTLEPQERCLGKHTLNIATLCSETANMDPANNKWLIEMSKEANEKHENFMKFICHVEELPLLTDWARGWRKKHIEPVYYACSTKAKMKEEADSHPFIASLFESDRTIKVAGTYRAGDLNLKVSHTAKTEAITHAVEDLPQTIDDVLSRISKKKLEVTNRTFAFGTTGLVRYEFFYRIVDGLTLVVSNDPFTFEPNPKYPQELQPRTRSRAAAELQVKSIAANIIPDILLVDFRATDRGAPIIGDDNVVESGNGRVMALILASRDATAKFAEYVAALKRIAPAYALKVEDIDKFKIPLLVRERLTSVNRKDFAQDCNAPVALEQSAIEKARSDADKVTVGMLQSIQVSEGQSVEDAIRSPANKQFAVAFLNKLPQNEQAKLLDAQGLLNSDGLRRIILAIFVSTFQGDTGLKLAEAFFESTDTNVKNVLNGITGSLGILAQAEGLCLSGARYADYVIGQDLAVAVTKFSEIKKSAGMTVDKYLHQSQMLTRQTTPFQERILQALDEQSRSGKRIAAMLSLYSQKVIDSAPPGQASFMAGKRYTREELFDSAVNQVVVELETEREEARRKAEARQPVGAMSDYQGNEPAGFMVRSLNSIIPKKFEQLKVGVNLQRSPNWDINKSPVIRKPEDAQIFFEDARVADREWLLILCFDTRLHLVGMFEQSIGNSSSAIVSPQELARIAVLTNATSIMMAHNHPSGDPEPSRDDRDVFESMKAALKLLQVEILDFFVIGHKRDYSMKEDRYMPAPESELRPMLFEEVGNMAEIARLFEVAQLEQQLRFMIDDVPAASAATSISCPPTCAVIVPSGKKLEFFDFQKEGAIWLENRSFALLADDMGLGKTPQAISWGTNRKPVLVVVPSALVLNWAREIGQMWRIGDTVKVLDGKEPFPATLPDWCVMSYGMVDRYLSDLQGAGFESIIIDEAHNVKNLDAARTKNILNLVAPEEDPERPFIGKLIPQRLAVTGTPILNRPIELFAVFVFLGVQRRSDYKDYLKTYTESKVIKGRTVYTGTKNLQQLYRFMQPFTLRRLKKDVLKDLPPKTITSLFVPISNAAEYRKAENNFLTWMREKFGDVAAAKASSAELIVKMNSLRQLAAAGKVLPVADWLKPCSDGQGKVIIFSTFKEPLDELARIKGASVVYSGSLAKEGRQQAVDDFQTTGKYCYFMGTIGAAGVGITLTAANRVCFLDLPWTPGAKTQGEDRAYRIGQTKPVEIVNVLAKGTIDERMLQILADKEFIIAQAIDGKTKDEALTGSISSNLIDSYMRQPNLNESVEQYEGELQDMPVDAVDADTLEILQGLREEVEDAGLEEQTGAKFRSLADAMQNQIDEKRNPAISQQNVTRRRSNISSGMAKDADYMEETQSALRGVANAIDAGTLPAVLSKITNKAQVEQILHHYYQLPEFHKSNLNALQELVKGKPGMSKERDILTGIVPRAQGEEAWQVPLYNSEEVAAIKKIIDLSPTTGWQNLRHILPDIAAGERLIALGIDSKEKFDQARADLKSYVSGPSPEVIAAQKKRELEAKLIGAKIPGFFPTPRAIVEEMVSRAGLGPGMSVLEPSAGKGDIADVIREKCPSCQLTLVEYNGSLIEILRAKGYMPVPADFLNYAPLQAHGTFDRVLMNPPFENGQDVDHVRHAFQLLKPGGRLIAIMGEHCFFGSEKKCSDFRDWLDTVGESEKLPEGSFTGAGAFVQTGVNARMVTIDRLEEAVIAPIERKFVWQANAEGGQAIGNRQIIRPPTFEDFEGEILPRTRFGWYKGSNSNEQYQDMLKREPDVYISFTDTGSGFQVTKIDHLANLLASIEAGKEHGWVKEVSNWEEGETFRKTTDSGAVAKFTPVQARLFEYSWLANQIDKCNVSVRDVEAALNYRPLRNLAATAIGQGARVSLCSIGLVYGMYQVTIDGLKDTEKIDVFPQQVHNIKRIHTMIADQRVFEVVLPKNEEKTELEFAPQEVSMKTVRKEPAEQAVMFESSVAKDLARSEKEEVKAIEVYRKRADKAKDAGDNKTRQLYEHISAEELGHYDELAGRAREIGGKVRLHEGKFSVCSLEEANKLERCIMLVKKKGTAANPWAVCKSTLGLKESGDIIKITGKCETGESEKCVYKVSKVGNSLKVIGSQQLVKAIRSPKLKEEAIPAKVQEAIEHPMEVKA